MSDENAAIIQAFVRYSKAFETLNPQAVAPHYHEPCLLISPQGIVALPTRADVTGFFRRLMKDLQGEGYQTSEFEGLKATSLSPMLAVVAGNGVWRKADGHELRRFGLTYTLGRQDDSWRILVAAVHDPHPSLPLR